MFYHSNTLYILKCLIGVSYSKDLGITNNYELFLSAKSTFWNNFLLIICYIVAVYCNEIVPIAPNDSVSYSHNAEERRANDTGFISKQFFYIKAKG